MPKATSGGTNSIAAARAPVEGTATRVASITLRKDCRKDAHGGRLLIFPYSVVGRLTAGKDGCETDGCLRWHDGRNGNRDVGVFGNGRDVVSEYSPDMKTKGIWTENEATLNSFFAKHALVQFYDQFKP